MVDCPHQILLVYRRVLTNGSVSNCSFHPPSVKHLHSMVPKMCPHRIRSRTKPCLMDRKKGLFKFSDDCCPGPKYFWQTPGQGLAHTLAAMG